MIIKSLISARNFFVKNFFVGIIGFKKSNKYIWLKSNLFLSLGYWVLLFIPFIFTNLISQWLNYDIIYNYDNIYYITNTNGNKIIPVLLEFSAYQSTNLNNICNLTSKLKYYNTSIPFEVFITWNIPKIYDCVKIKYLFKGLIKEKHIIINNYKNHLIYNLFEN